MRTSILVLLALIGAAATASAQTVEPRGSASAVFGGGRTWDDEGSLGAGVVASGRAGRRISGRTTLEGSVDLLTHDRSGGFFEAEGTSALLSASLIRRFGQTVQPYVLGGYSLVFHRGAVTFDGLRQDRDSTGHGFHVGGGIAVRAGRFEAGPEARLYMIQPDDDLDPAAAYWIGARFGVRF